MNFIQSRFFFSNICNFFKLYERICNLHKRLIFQNFCFLMQFYKKKFLEIVPTYLHRY